MAPTLEDDLASGVVFAPIQAPLFHRIEPIHVSAFLRDREHYELEVRTKTSHVPSLSVPYYEVCIDRALLGHLIVMGKFHSDGIEVNTDKCFGDQVENYLR